MLVGFPVGEELDVQALGSLWFTQALYPRESGLFASP